MIALDCSMAGGGPAAFNVWVDTDRSTVTVKNGGQPIETHAAQITATSISWSIDPNSNLHIASEINRISGEMVETLTGAFAPTAGNVQHFQCARGSAVLPPTKF